MTNFAYKFYDNGQVDKTTRVSKSYESIWQTLASETFMDYEHKPTECHNKQINRRIRRLNMKHFKINSSVIPW